MDLNLKKFLYFGVENRVVYNKTLKELSHINSLEYLIQNNELTLVKELFNECNNYDVKYLLAVLARCCCIKDNTEFKKECFNITQSVCKTSEDIFMFMYFYNTIHRKLYNSNGWTKYTKSFISNWYNNQDIEELIYNITNCHKKYGWSHKTLIKLAHIKAKNEMYSIVFKYIISGKEVLRNVEWDSPLKFLIAYECIKYETNEYNIIEYIRLFKFNERQIPQYFLKYNTVWRNLIHNMNGDTLLKSIHSLHDIKFFDDTLNTNLFIEKLESNKTTSPLKYLYAWKNYMNYTLYTNEVIVNELKMQFYKSFNSLDKLDKNICIGLNIGDNLPICSSNMYSHELSCALSMLFDFTEENCNIYGFKDEKMVPTNITSASCLEENMENIDVYPSNYCDELFKKKDDIIILISDRFIQLNTNNDSKYIVIYLNNSLLNYNLKNVLEINGDCENIYEIICKFCQEF